MTDQLITFLKSLDAFQYLPASIFTEIKSKVVLRKFKRGTVICHEGFPSEYVYFIKEGLVAAKKANTVREIVVGLVVPLGMFGATDGDGGGSQLFSAVAEKDTVAYCVPRRDFAGWMERHPELMKGLVRYFTNQLRLLIAFMEINLDVVEIRLARILALLSVPFGSVIPLSRSQLAEIANTTVETCVRNMKILEKKGLVKATWGKIEVLDLKNLLGDYKPFRPH